MITYRANNAMVNSEPQECAPSSYNTAETIETVSCRGRDSPVARSLWRRDRSETHWNNSR
jgi:hypothetical protein